MIGFPPKSHHHHQHHDIQNGPVSSWKGFFARPAAGPSSISSPKQADFNYQHDLTELLDAGGDDDDDPSSLRSSCVFTCEGLERPSHGLSLSLSSSNPSSIGLQSFELRQQQQHQHQQDDFIRFGPSSSRSVNNNNIQQYHAYIRHSRYLGPAQELLSEFCNLGSTKRNEDITKMRAIQDTEINAIKKQSLYSLDFVELQRRKNKLLHMLEEVDRRYKHYCEQMRAVVSSFESVAGHGAASTYSALASRAMSRHFRCLKDGVLSQIKETKKAMGEKGDTSAAPGTVKGETPRLRLLDQTLRQQRALHQMSNMEIHPWRPQRGLPERSVSVLRAWLFEHFLHPYPSDVDKHILARQTGLSRSQVSNWFINARVRLWKPMVEEMYLEELKEDQPRNDAALSVEENDGPRNTNQPLEQKPTHDQLVRIESECLSSIIIKNDVGKNKAIQNPDSFGDSFGAMEFDFSAYGSHPGGGGEHHHHHHQIVEDCQTVQYSLLDGGDRNLMGAQLLHDLAG
ncbi:homeobox protein bel1 homolog [Phtheirospermum japonicum]|uniref:Homeobox protein bel1 homolog n=1 Tax=Phtheirospermum japonicum TaxID=374723 RepID=A0A830D6A1_9LAMI|nr:homeobox protein bel1 homolog [Phtheirospermum japonicum]